MFWLLLGLPLLAACSQLDSLYLYNATSKEITVLLNDEIYDPSRYKIAREKVARVYLNFNLVNTIEIQQGADRNCYAIPIIPMGLIQPSLSGAKLFATLTESLEIVIYPNDSDEQTYYHKKVPQTRPKGFPLKSKPCQ